LLIIYHSKFILHHLFPPIRCAVPFFEIKDSTKSISIGSSPSAARFPPLNIHWIFTLRDRSVIIYYSFLPTRFAVPSLEYPLDIHPAGSVGHQTYSFRFSGFLSQFSYFTKLLPKSTSVPIFSFQCINLEAGNSNG